MEKLDRHDITEADAFGQLVALEAGIVALMLATSDSGALSAAWRIAEDRAFTQSSEPNGLDEQRHEIAKTACASTLARLRSVVEDRSARQRHASRGTDETGTAGRQVFLPHSAVVAVLLEESGELWRFGFGPTRDAQPFQAASRLAVAGAPNTSGRSNSQSMPVIAEISRTRVAGALPRLIHSATDGCLMPRRSARRLCPPAIRTAVWMGVSIDIRQSYVRPMFQCKGQPMLFSHRIQAMPIHRDTTTFGGRLHDCMDDLGLPERGRQAYISQRFKVSQPTAKGYLDNKIMPGRPRMLKMASEFGVMLEWLSAGKGDKLHSSPGMVRDAAMVYGAPDIRVIPLVSYVEAGVWSDSNDPYPRGQGMESIGVDPELASHLSRVAFALKIEGSSMEPEFQPGDVIIVDPNIQPRPGDLVVAKLDGEEKATFKKYRDRGVDTNGERVIELVPLNPDYPTLHVSASTPGRIIATMIEHRRRRRF